MAKRKPPSLQQTYVLEYAQGLKEAISRDEKKSMRDIAEIGCSLVRMSKKTVRIIEWNDRWKSVVCEVNGEVVRYNWPLHENCYYRFVDFEVIEDCGYLERFANGEEYTVNGRRYAVKDDVVWAGGIRYISSHEKVKFGSFKTFLSKQQGFTVKKAII
jgi:hypothetical protein